MGFYVIFAELGLFSFLFFFDLCFFFLQISVNTQLMDFRLVWLMKATCLNGVSPLLDLKILYSEWSPCFCLDFEFGFVANLFLEFVVVA